MADSKVDGTTFLYPRSRQYLFDETCENIVRELERRAWSVPGIRVDFDTYDVRGVTYRGVDRLSGDGWELWFCRVQGRLGRDHNDVSAVAELTIPGKELKVHEDYSGPILYVYAGDNWDRDKDSFVGRVKVNSKLHRRPRLYLYYTGACNCHNAEDGLRHTHPGQLAPLLTHNNDLGREYDLAEGDVAQYTTRGVFEEFDTWLKNNVLAKILEHPID